MIKRKIRKPIDLEELKSKFLEGISIKQLAKYFNISPAIIMVRLKQINLCFRHIQNRVIDLEEEIWKDIPNYPNYQVSNKSRIKCIDRVVKNGGREQFWPEQLMTQYINKDGYYDISIRMNDDQIQRRVHRLIGFTFIVGYFEGAVINHKDGNKLNNSLSNLEWTTPAGNHSHAVKIRLDKGISGIDNPKAKLNINQILEIRTSSKSNKELSEIYNVHISTIKSIKSFKTWKT